MLAIILQQTTANAKKTESCHVENILAIPLLEYQLEQNKVVIEFSYAMGKLILP